MTSIEPTLFDKIGYIGPVILFVFNILQLFHRKPYLYAYLLCFVANSGLNKILKNAIAEPRPSVECIAFMESVMVGKIRYAIGSCPIHFFLNSLCISHHRQHLVYSLPFLWRIDVVSAL